jgi:hypothetical protein
VRAASWRLTVPHRAMVAAPRMSKHLATLTG